MRASRISARELSDLVASASPSTSALTPRRGTHRSLAKYACPPSSAANVVKTKRDEDDFYGEKETGLFLGSDIEDAVTEQPRSKRRRVEITVRTENTASSSTRKPRRTIGTKRVEEEFVIKNEAEADVVAPKTKLVVRRARKPARRTTDPDTGKSIVEPPSDWEEMYELLRQMRAPGGVAYGAPVDTMGCERLADRAAPPSDQRFHTLIALMLSSQTKDTVNAVVMQRLKTELPAWREGEPVGLNLENVLAVEPNLLNEMIWAVGFHNNKTKYIKQAALNLRDKWNGDIPDTIEGLMSLPGVGPKMAYLCMSAAWNRTEGIGVDVHVHRITNLWGWNGPRPTGTPEETRLALQSWLPRDRWREINGLLVGLGQSVCLPVGRKCGDCELGLGGLCKAADRAKVAEGRRRREGGGDVLLRRGGRIKTEVEAPEGLVKTEELETERVVKVKKEDDE